jgi:hypothetical protein
MMGGRDAASGDKGLARGKNAREQPASPLCHISFCNTVT